jgi:hypothetical protein
MSYTTVEQRTTVHTTMIKALGGHVSFEGSSALGNIIHAPFPSLHTLNMVKAMKAMGSAPYLDTCSGQGNYMYG